MKKQAVDDLNFIYDIKELAAAEIARYDQGSNSTNELLV